MSQTEIKTIAPKVERPFLAASRSTVVEDPKQKKLMLGTLSLLVLTLVVLLWHERDFWFPDSPDADLDQPAETVPAAKGAPRPVRQRRLLRSQSLSTRPLQHRLKLRLLRRQRLLQLQPPHARFCRLWKWKSSRVIIIERFVRAVVRCAWTYSREQRRNPLTSPLSSKHPRRRM